jgi:hypothetical protein
MDYSSNTANLSMTTAEANLNLAVVGTAPAVTSVTASPSVITSGGSAFVASGGIAVITLEMSELASVTGTPVLDLNDGGTASYVGGSGTTSLTFDYVAGSETTADLKITGINQTGGTITASGGNGLSSNLSSNLSLAVNADSWKTGASGNFTSGAKWSLGSAPTSSQEASIAVAGTYTVSVTNGTSAMVAALSISDKTATLLVMSGGTFSAVSGTGVDANLGTIAVNSGGTLDIGGAVNNSGTIEALGNNASALLNSTTVDNASNGVILASGAGAQVDLDNATISGGTLKTSASGAAIETVSVSADNIAGVTIAGGAVVETTAGATLTLSGGTIGSGAMVEVLSGGTVIVSGTVANSGMLFASGANGILDIAGVVNGGITEVGNGTVEIAGASSENVSFLSNGSGTLQLNNASAYTGKVSSFGVGVSTHSDHNEHIDLTAITYSSGMVNETYSGNTTSGVLTVMSGAAIVATIAMLGSYVTSNFTLSAGVGGSGTIITDPSSDTAHSANLALLGNYIAGSFVTAAGQGGTVISNTSQGEQPLLAHPHA